MNRQERRTSRFDVRRTNVTACNRCRSRKQRCDQRLPACSNCERAGTECVGYDVVSGRVAPRSYLQSLEDRVAFLEKRLQAHGISVDDDADAVPTTSEDRSHRAASIRPTLGSNPSSTQSQPNPALSIPFIGSGSEVWLLQLLLMKLRTETRSTTDTHAPESNANRVEDEMFPLSAINQLPTIETAHRLTQTYFEHCDWFLPVLHRPQFLSDLESIYQDPSPSSIPEGAEYCYFTYYMVMAVGLVLLAKTDSSRPSSVSERFLTSAMNIVQDRPLSILTNDLNHMQAMTLLAQYISLHPKPTGAWQIIGIAVRLALDLGLYEEPPSGFTTDNLELEKRRRLFWAAYSLELNICVVLGRPPGIPDEAITIHYPLAVDDVNITQNEILPQEIPSKKLAALWILKCRRLEAETQAVLFRETARGYPPLDLSTWRSGMAERLQKLYDSKPPIFSSLRFEPMDVFEGFYCNLMVYLYSPTKNFPTLSMDEAIILAKAAIHSIEIYRQGFRDETFRYYWRTTIRLFRAGTAILYCILYVAGIKSQFSPNELTIALNTCSAVLWGMVERFPGGKRYRDIFDQMVKGVSDSDNPMLAETLINNTSISSDATFPVQETMFPLYDNGWNDATQYQGDETQRDEFDDLQFLLATSDGAILNGFDAYA